MVNNTDEFPKGKKGFRVVCSLRKKTAFVKHAVRKTIVPDRKALASIVKLM